MAQILPLSNGLHSFISGGAGWYSSIIEMDGRGNSGNYSIDRWKGSESANGIGCHGLAGVEFIINPNTSLGMEVKWFKAKLDFNDFSNDRFNVGGTTAGLVSRYKF